MVFSLELASNLSADAQTYFTFSDNGTATFLSDSLVTLRSRASECMVTSYVFVTDTTFTHSTTS